MGHYDSCYTPFNELVNRFNTGTLHDKDENDFVCAVSTMVECGAQPIIWISATDPEINTAQDAIDYISRKTAVEDYDAVLQFDNDFVLSDDKTYDTQDYSSYEEYVAKNGYKITNPDLDIMIGVCGKYWITIISIPG